MPDSPDSVFKNFHPEERIKKVADSYAGFTGYVWTEAESAKKKLWIPKNPDTLWTGQRILFTDNIQSGGSCSVNCQQLYFHIRFQACFGCLSSEGFNNPFFFSLFFVALQRPLVNEPELNNQLNNDLRLRAVMIVYIEVERSYVTD